MSNCIDFHEGTNVISFTRDEIDVAAVVKYLELADTGEKHPDMGAPDTPENEKLWFNHNLWWFFSKKNVDVVNGGIYVRLGEGQSSHTRRDYRYIMNYVIKPIMKKSKGWRFILSDEYDGHDSRFMEYVDFKLGVK